MVLLTVILTDKAARKAALLATAVTGIVIYCHLNTTHNVKRTAESFVVEGSFANIKLILNACDVSTAVEFHCSRGKALALTNMQLLYVLTVCTNLAHFTFMAQISALENGRPFLARHQSVGGLTFIDAVLC